MNTHNIQPKTPDDSSPVIGRFAPSPTGRLHFGSLITAVASFCHTKHHGGKWLVRIEDTDWQRCKSEHSTHILQTLDSYGLHWDDDVIYQSQRLEYYDHALATLSRSQHAYSCECSRKTLAAYAKAHQNTDNIYPRLCINKQLNPTDQNIRLVVPDDHIIFEDIVQGTVNINAQKTLGDMVLKRRDGIINYILSSAVDDAAQGVTQIIRGLDLLELTPVQMTLAEMLSLPKIKKYGHLPLALNADGQKLSKQTKAKEISTENIPKILHEILHTLKQPAVDQDTPERMLVQAVSQWDITHIQHQQTLDGEFQ